MPHATDLDLTPRDVAQLASPDAIAAFFAKLGYDTAARTSLSPQAIGLSGETASVIKRIETVSEDPEKFLRVVFAQSKSLTAKVRNDLVRVLGRGTLDHLLVLASDFDTLEFVFLEKRKREQKGPAASERIQVVPKVISINRRNPTRLELKAMRRFTWTCRDALDQFDKLRSVFDAAAYTGEYFQNRGLFSDHFLRDRLREDPVWRENPSELFAFVRDLLRDGQGRWGSSNTARPAGRRDKDTLRNGLLEPLFKRLGFSAAVHRPSKSDQTQPDYLLTVGDDKTLTAAFVYSWDRWLDGPDLNDTDTPEENPGACVVTALDAGTADWIIVTNGRLWRLYSRQAHARATNFYEVDLVEALTASGDTDPNEAFRYWSLFFRQDAFLPLPLPPGEGRGEGGTRQSMACWLDNILMGSREYAKRLGERLKDRIFVSIFPHLAQGFLVDRKQRLGQNQEPDGDELAELFEATLTLLYRLLFLLYAESRDLLPIREAPYHEASLKKIKEEIAGKAGVAESGLAEALQKAYSPKETTLYDRLCQLFQAMDKGDPVLNVPTYNGGLFMHPQADSRGRGEGATLPLPPGEGRGEGGTQPDEAIHPTTTPLSAHPHPNPLPEGEGTREQRIARFLATHKVPDRQLALAIDLLARDQDERTLGLVYIDYKSLEVRHLGSIYEGLLEFKLKVADEDLTTQTDKKGETYIPLSKAKPQSSRHAPRAVTTRRKTPDKPTVVAKGHVYLSNDKAERKASGSYYTPDPIVEYIVANTVGPVFDEKLESLRPDFRKVRKTFDNELQKSQAYPSQEVKDGVLDHRQWAGQKTYLAHRQLVEKLFEFRVLDPAMGSGHFLVETVDFLTDKLLNFLNQFPINPVNFALDRTRASILESLGEQGVTVDPAKLTDINLLKRHVLKRCIYGVDLNPMAVELAKVSLWLDAFTLGAPLNFLDHHLRCGNALIGATFDDLRAATSSRLFGIDYEPLLRAIHHVLHVNKMADATAAEVRQSASEYGHARGELSGYQIVLDLLVARHFGHPKAPGLLEHGDNLDLTSRARFMASLDDLEELALVERVESLAHRPDLRFFHWEVEFPEVFFTFSDADGRHLTHKNEIAEGSAGFDAVVGNPPYGGELEAAVKKAMTTLLPLSKSNPDTAIAFVEKAMSLAAPLRRIGLIVPKPLTYSFSWRQTRDFLRGRLREIADVSRAWREVLLEQIVLIAQKGDSERRYLRRTLIGSAFSPPRELSWDAATRYDTIPCSLSDAEQELLEALRVEDSTVGELCKTYRGLGLQRHLKASGKTPVLGGRDLERWALRSASGYLPDDHCPAEHERFHPEKLVFQNIIAHVANPTPHILLIGAYDSEQNITLDTVNNIVAKQNGVDLYAVLALLHSEVVNWFVYSAVYNKAIRTMHFDQYFLDKIPLPKGFGRLQPALAELARDCTRATNTIRMILSNVECELASAGPRCSPNRVIEALAEAAGPAAAGSRIRDSLPRPALPVYEHMASRFVGELGDCCRARNQCMDKINEYVESAYEVTAYKKIFTTSSPSFNERT